MRETSPENATDMRSSRVDAAAVVLLVTMAAVVLMKDITQGGFRYGDAAVHAMDGVLIHDWIQAGSDAWRDPIAFAEQQYGHYPSLGIGRHYPPGYAIVEALFFRVLGVSVVTARLCVVLFGVLAAVGAYVFVRPWGGRVAATLAAVGLICMPATTTWGRQNMLEVPTLCTLVWAAVLWGAYIRKPSWRWLAAALMAAAMCLLFKQPAIFLLGAMTLTIAVQAVRRRVPWPHAIAAAVFSGAVLMALIRSLDGLGATVLEGAEHQAIGTGLQSLLYYARAIPGQTGWPWLTLAVIGGVYCCRRSPALGIMSLCWFAMCYLMVTVVGFKNPRFFYFGLFPLAIWGGMLLAWLVHRVPGHAVRAVAVVVLTAGSAAWALTHEVELRPDYGPIVEANRDRIEGQIVLFSGIRDGDFVFAVRERLPWRSSVVIRGSKLLYTCNAMPEIDFDSRVEDVSGVSQLLERYGLRNVFVERDNKLQIQEETLLRDYLAGGTDYDLVHTYKLHDRWIPAEYRVTLDLYEATHPTAPADDHFVIYIPRSKRSIRVDLSAYRPS